MMYIFRGSALGVLFLVLLAPQGCGQFSLRGVSSESEQRACDELISAVRLAFRAGSAPLSEEAAMFATRRGLGINIATAGNRYNFLPRAVPNTLLAVADVPWEYFRVSPEDRMELAERGRRCEW
jgi:hypothetical protein